MSFLVHNPRNRLKDPNLLKQWLENYFLTQPPEALPHSSFYTAQSGVNPLIAAAQPLLSMISRIKQATSLQMLSDLKRSVLHELQVYEKQSLQRGMNMEQVLIGRYCLSAMLDEVLLNSVIKKAWEDTRLLPKQKQHTPPEAQFFKWLKKLLLKPEQNIACLELIYLLLSLGYEGKYATQVNKGQHLNQMMEQLYEVIRLYRGCYQTKLLVQQREYRVVQNKIKWLPVTIIGLSLVLGLIFIAFNYVLDVNASVVLNEFHQTMERLI